MNSIEPEKMVIHNRNGMTKRYKRSLLTLYYTTWILAIFFAAFWAKLIYDWVYVDKEVFDLSFGGDLFPLCLLWLLFSYMYVGAANIQLQHFHDRFEIDAEGIRVIRFGRTKVYPWSTFHYIRKAPPGNGGIGEKIVLEWEQKYTEVELFRRYIPRGDIDSQYGRNFGELTFKEITLFLDTETELPEFLRYCGGERWEVKPGKRYPRRWDSERLMRRTRRGAVVMTALLYFLVRTLYGKGMVASARMLSFVGTFLFINEILRGLLLIVDGILGNEKRDQAMVYKKDVLIIPVISAIKVRCKWILLEGEDGRKKRLFFYEPLCLEKLRPGMELRLTYYPLSRVIKKVTVLPEKAAPFGD